MENIRLFETQEEYIKEKPLLPYPSVSFIEETQSVEYYDLPFITAKYVIDKYTIDYCKNNGIEEFVLYSNSVGSVKEYRLNGQTYSFDENAYEIVEKKIIHERDDFFSPTQDCLVEIKPIQKLTFSTNSDVTLDDYLYIEGYLKDDNQPRNHVWQIKDVFYDNESMIIMSKDLKSCSLSSSFLNRYETITISYIDNNSVIIHEDGLIDILKPNYETIITNKIFLETNNTFNGVITVPLPEKEKNYELKILLNEGVTSIGQYTNYNNSFNFLMYYGSPLTEIDLTELDKNYSYEIPYESFAFSRLKTIKIPQNIVYIDNVILERCNHLTSINVDKNNPYYDSRENCNAIIHTHSNTLICGCNTTIIPENIVNIGLASFWGLSGFTDIVIPDSVVEIESNAFEACSLTSVTFGKSLEHIGLRAFCCPLKKITFTSYEKPSFVNQYEGRLSPYLETWRPYDNNTFYSIDSDGIMYYPYQSEGYDKQLYDFDYNGWVKYDFFDYEISKVGAVATYNVTDINNPTHLNNDTDGYFMKIDGKEVESTDSYLFDTLGNHTVEYYFSSKDFDTPTLDYDEGFFKGVENLVSISITDYMTGIYQDTFSNCTNLKEIVIPDSVTSIDDDAFNYCSGLTEIIIPDSVTWIGDRAFYICSGLTSVTIGNSVTNIGYMAFGYCSGLTEIVIPDSVTSIEGGAFQDCYNLTSVTIGDSVTSIGSGAFVHCSSLSNITVSELNEVYDSRENCNAIINTSTNELVLGCKNTIILDSVTSIGDSAFNGCSGLTEIVIPDSVTSIGGGAFLKCTSLTSINIPDSVTSISDGAFQSCSGLTEIVIPDSVTSIGRSAFQSCKGAISVTIGSGVTNIGSEAFYGICSKTIICRAKIAPTLSSNTFNGIQSNGTLYYPQGSDYSSWMSTDGFYLGFYNWTSQEIEVQTEE